MDTYSNIDPFSVAGELLSIDGQEISTAAELEQLLASHRAGEQLQVVYETLSGVDRRALATVEERHRVRTAITAREDATALQLAIRNGITASRR